MRNVRKEENDTNNHTPRWKWYERVMIRKTGRESIQKILRKLGFEWYDLRNKRVGKFR